MITTTKEEITDVFAVWLKEYAESPQEFASFKDSLSVEDYVDYFLNILSTIQECKRCIK